MLSAGEAKLDLRAKLLPQALRQYSHGIRLSSDLKLCLAMNFLLFNFGSL